MKNFSMNLAIILLLSYNTLAQNEALHFRIESKHNIPVLKENLIKANTMADLSNGYPASWISEYVSSEVSTMSNGARMTAIGKNDFLNAEQKSILQNIDHGNDVEISIKYKLKTAATDLETIRHMNFVVTAMPNSEAEFPGGQSKLTQYFEEMAMNKIKPIYPDQNKMTKAKFTINKQGLPIGFKILNSSGNVEIDNLLLKTIQEMPKWKPALDLKGETQNQDFLVIVGQNGC